MKGGQINWFYYEVGVYAWITEFWTRSRPWGSRRTTRRSGWSDEAPALIRWSDEELGGRGLVDWYPFQHPQLGPVELGGWDIVNYWYNPPFDRI